MGLAELWGPLACDECRVWLAAAVPRGVGTGLGGGVRVRTAAGVTRLASRASSCTSSSCCFKSASRNVIVAGVVLIGLVRVVCSGLWTRFRRRSLAGWVFGRTNSEAPSSLTKLIVHWSCRATRLRVTSRRGKEVVLDEALDAGGFGEGGVLGGRPLVGVCRTSAAPTPCQRRIAPTRFAQLTSQ